MLKFLDSSVLITVAIVVVVIFLLASGYVKAPTDKAFIISGLRKIPSYMLKFLDSSVLITVAIVVVVIFLLASGYVKAPTDKAFIISGLRKIPRVVIGRATIKVPFLERKDELTLQLIQNAEILR